MIAVFVVGAILVLLVTVLVLRRNAKDLKDA